MAKFEDLAVRYMVDLISDFDLEPFQAAGIVGNGGTESGGFTQIQEVSPVGGGRGGLGHFQWTGPRRRDFEAWLERNADKNWTAETYEANYSMLFRELVGPEAASIPAVKRTATLEAATEAFMLKFERPGVPHLDNRISWARKALAAFVAAGSPARPTAPKQPQEILPPLAKLDPNALAPLLNALLPVLLQALTARAQPSGAQPQPGQQPDILALLGPLLAGLTGGQPIALPPPAPVLEPPKPEPAPVVVKSEPKTAVGVGLIGLLGSVLGMVGGQIGTPFGMGEAPTTAGTLSVVIPAAISMIGATGIFGPWGAVAGKLVGVLATSIASKAPK